MNRKQIEDRELRRNGEGYYDPTAYEAIKRADAELEGKKKTKKKESAYTKKIPSWRSLR